MVGGELEFCVGKIYICVCMYVPYFKILKSELGF